MENFLELAKDRFSVRKFLDQPVREQDLDLILEAGKLAPTACNNQPQKVFVLTSDEDLATIDRLTKCRFGAPTVLLICYDEEREWVNPMEPEVRGGTVDAAIVTTHMMLEAWESGVASCWVAWFPPTKTAEAFDLPNNLHPVALLPLGYPAPDAEPAASHEKYRDHDDWIVKR